MFKICLTVFPILAPITRKGPKCAWNSAAFPIKVTKSALAFESMLFIFHTFGELILVESAFASIRPKMPPIPPPAACNPTRNAKPPNIVTREFGLMKRFPIITSASAVGVAEVKSKLITLGSDFSRQF